MAKLISFENVEISAQGKPLLKGVNWNIESGNHYAVTGRIGTGKTILGKALCGKMHVSKGKIHYHFMEDVSDYSSRHREIQMVSFTDSTKLFTGANADHYYQQRYNAFDADGHLTAHDYLVSHGFGVGHPQHQNIIERLGITALLDLERIKLSSGQTRKLILASALIEEPTILWLDNPHVGLDVQSRTEFNVLIDRLAELENITFILSGHFLSFPQCITSTLDLDVDFADDLHQEAHQFPFTKPVSEPIKRHFENFDFQALEPLVEMQNVQIAYSGSQILKQFNWRVVQGDKWAVLGPNGSGKSTLLSCIYADHPQVYANQISLFGKRRGQGESIWDIKAKIGFTSPELHAYFRYNFTASELILSGLWDRFVKKQPSEESLRLVDWLLGFFGLESLRDTAYRQLSTGTQRLCFFLRALIKNPPLLLLDEPYQAMDEITIRRCNDLLEHILTPDHSLIFISHFGHHTPDIVAQHLYLSQL